ncbi:MAG: electron transport complex subunit RsxE [Prevotellaceae bacterium]|jgi:electron transport complex protein RnfE|nr:electron transport complex subunit RsxE [Prevotellaceae bacterium]
MRPLHFFTESIIRKNPVFVMLLALCPAAGMSAFLSDALMLGGLTCGVLLFAEMLMALLRKVIVPQARLTVCLMIVAFLVTVADMMMQACLPVQRERLGLFLPLITVNCMVLHGMNFAARHTVSAALWHALGTGIGFWLVMALVGTVRELLGSGSLFGYVIYPSQFTIPVIAGASGALLVLGCLMALFNHLLPEKRTPAIPKYVDP